MGVRLRIAVRGVVLPEAEERTLWIDQGVVHTEPLRDCDLVADGGWIVPGLVDTHTHPGTEKPSDVFDDATLRRHLVGHRDRGVLLVRTPGTAERVPGWVDEDETLPRVRSAGPWLATPGRFFPGYGRDITEDELVAAAVEEVKASSGWCKVVGDWTPTDPPVPGELLRAVADAVHAVGGRLAVHCTTAEGCCNAVSAGADSLEHGWHLDESLLDTMAASGTVLVPTLVAFAPAIEKLRPTPSDVRRDWLVSGWDAMMGSTVRCAFEAGVTVLAGTDSMPFGNVSSEVEWLLKAGLPAAEAVGAASWTARTWLGLPGLTEGAPADLVVFPRDPRRDPSVLRSPSRIVLRGRVIA
jgi:imidazolonepropionase-like amidohydrolase